MHFSLENRTVSLSVGEFAGFSLGPHESGGGPQGLWRAQLGQHWHNELQKRTELEFTVGGALRPDVKFEVVIDGRITHRGWTFILSGRIDQQIGHTLREIKSVTRPLPADETELRARLTGRGTDSDEVIALRMKNALEEMAHWPEYTYLLVSSTREEDYVRFLSLVTAERLRVSRIG